MLRFWAILLVLFSVTGTSAAATPIIGGTGFKALSAGGYFTLALQSDGSLIGWGANGNGQLGDGTTDSRLSPAPVGSDSDWLTVANGYLHTVALKQDHSLWTWGQNSGGQLGDGSTTDRHSPQQVGTDKDWVYIGPGYDYTFAIKSDGSLWGWGNNFVGELGLGDTVSRLTPVQIGTDKDWASVSASGHTLAIKKDGSLWGWGFNYSGEVGDGTNISPLSPVRVGSDTDWAAVSAGFCCHSMALKKDGSLWAWGSNWVGQVGDGTNNFHYSPVQIGSDKDWFAISGGYYHSVAMKNDGSLWSWGLNYEGEVGDGSYSDRDTPTLIGQGYAGVASGADHGVAVKSDGSLWGWGSNRYGQVGDGSTLNRYIPVEITVAIVGANVTPTLTMGWNLLGNGTTGSFKVADIFGDANKVLTVWKWLPAPIGGWAFYSPQYADGGVQYAAGRGYTPLTTINGGEGFWVNAKTSFSTTFGSGSLVPTSRFADGLGGDALPAAWNLIAVGDNPTPRAFANSISIMPPDAGVAAATSILTLWAWNPGNGTSMPGWYFYAPTKDNDGTLGSYSTSKGYLDFRTTDKSLDAKTGFWVNHP